MIKLTGLYGAVEFYLNPDKIIYMVPFQSGSRIILDPTSESGMVEVTETIQMVAARIDQYRMTQR